MLRVTGCGFLILDNLINIKLTWILHVSEAFICKAFKGAAVADYCPAKAEITQQMGASGSPAG